VIDTEPAEGDNAICFLLMFMPDEATMYHPKRKRRIKTGTR
jgi:hypothetical protein